MTNARQSAKALEPGQATESMSAENMAGPTRRQRIPVQGHPGIYKRGRRYAVRVRDASGRDVQRAARTLAEARVLKATLTADAKRGVPAADTRVTFAGYAERWKESYRGRTGRGVRPETLAEYRRDLDRWAVPYFGRTRLAAITPPAMRDFIAHLEQHEPRLSPASVVSR